MSNLKLFRYRPVNDKTFQELATGQIWHSKFTELNDPFEAVYIDKTAGGLQYLVDTFRVCCFSKINDNLLMWSHYADSHRGLCVEYELDTETYKSRVMHVRYQTAMPALETIRLHPNGTLSVNIDEEARIFLTKSEDWAYEQECRIIIISKEPSEKGRLAAAPAPLSAVYFGIRAAAATIHATNTSLSGRPSVEFYQAYLEQDEYRLRFESIDRTQL